MSCSPAFDTRLFNEKSTIRRTIMLVIKDVAERRELDSKEMSAIAGGMTVR